MCDQALLPVVIARRGDRDAGQVLIKLLRQGRGCELVARRFSADGSRAWMVVAGGAVENAEQACDDYIARELDIDQDLWVIEIEDPACLYEPDGLEPLRA